MAPPPDLAAGVLTAASGLPAGGLLLALLVASSVTGCIGSLVGLGGGVLIIPLLTLGFGVHIHYAMGTSLVSIIATSTGAATSTLTERITNVRIGILLEVATTLGALLGVALAGLLAPATLHLVFGLVLMASLVPLAGRLGEELPPPGPPDPLATRLGLEGQYHDRLLGRAVPYQAHRVGLALPLMLSAGTISGMLGIGAGAFKVLAMDLVMRLPLKVSTATSNFMIGVTAAASAWIYLARGYVHPLLTAPVVLGTLAGAALGARLLGRLANRTVRTIVLPVILLVSLQMVRRGLNP